MIFNRVLFPALALVAAMPLSSLADDVHCPPDLGNVTVDGNVLIAAPCRMNGTIVKGNVHLYAGGSLIARGPVRIEGSVQAENADFIDLEGTSVNGSIQLDNLVGDRSIISDGTVGGSIQLKKNRSRLEVLRNEVNADVQAFENNGGVLIADNVIDGNLQCKSNQPPPAGGGNSVQGNKEDQCANLQPENGTGGTGGTGNTRGALSGAGSASANSGGGSTGLLSSLTLLSMVMLRVGAAARRRRLA